MLAPGREQSSADSDHPAEHRSKRPRPGGLEIARRRFGARSAIPATIVLIATLVVPTVLTVYYSLHANSDVGDGVGDFNGLDNYRIVVETPLFWQSLRVTLIFAGGFVVLSTLLGLAMALLLNQRFVGRGIARALLVLPWACPWLVIGIIWNRFLGSDTFAGIPQILNWLGLGDSHHALLSDPNWALGLAIVAAAWRQSCFAALLLLAGLQSLPEEIVEAASMDGAGAWRRLMHITLPWLRPVLAVVTVLNVIYGFLQFDIVFSLTHGGPGTATEILSMLIYKTLFATSHIGTGSAVSVILALLALVGGLIAVRLMYRRVEI